MSSGHPAPFPSVPWSFAAIPPEDSDPEECRIVVIPVPYDGTTSYRGGAREGPHAIIEASRYLEDYDIELDRETWKVGVHTAPEVEPHMGGPRDMVDRVRNVVEPWARKGKLPALLGGEHSITVGAVEALGEVYQDLSVLYLDAHGDLRDEYMGSKFSHACAARRIWEMCPLVEVGVRSLSQEEMHFIREKNLKVHLLGEGSTSYPWDTEEIVNSLSRSVYISVDLDVLDPGFMAAVGTPEPGGLGWEPMLSLLRAVCRERSVVGFDIMELCPAAGPPSCAFVAAKLAYKLMGYATEGDPGA